MAPIPGNPQLVSINLSNPAALAQQDSITLTSSVRDLDIYSWVTFIGMNLTVHRRAYLALYSDGVGEVDVSEPAEFGMLIESSFGGEKVYYLTAANGSPLHIGPPTEIYMCKQNCAIIISTIRRTLPVAR